MSGFIKINGVEVAVPVSGANKLLGRTTSGPGAHEEIVISSLTELTDPEAGDFLLAESAEGELMFVDVGNLPSGGGGGGASYLVYTALLSQSGTDAPTAVVLENTLGGTVTYTRDGIGFYYIVLSTEWVDLSKIWYSAPSFASGSAGVGVFVRLDLVGSDTVGGLVLRFEDNNVVGVEDIGMTGYPIEIRVYP
jgi:hypothetical protein